MLARDYEWTTIQIMPAPPGAMHRYEGYGRLPAPCLMLQELREGEPPYMTRVVFGLDDGTGEVTTPDLESGSYLGIDYDA